MKVFKNTKGIEMINDEFIVFIKQVSENLRGLKRYDCKKADILGRVAKLTEEVGEFTGATLTSIGSASERKLKTFNKHDLIEEFGDVIITACLLANELDIDIKEALTFRKQEIEARWKK